MCMLCKLLLSCAAAVSCVLVWCCDTLSTRCPLSFLTSLEQDTGFAIEITPLVPLQGCVTPLVPLRGRGLYPSTILMNAQPLVHIHTGFHGTHEPQ